MMLRKYGLILAAIVLAAWCAPRPCLADSDYVLSFQERDEYDKWIPHDISGVQKTLKGVKSSVRRDDHGTVIPEKAFTGRRTSGKHFLQVSVNGKEVYLKDVGQGGPLYHEQVKFSVPDGADVAISFKLILKGNWSEGLSIHIGNVRVKDARGGEVRMTGKWRYEESRSEMYGHFFPGYAFPYHTGFSLNAPKRSLKAGDNCAYVWQGKLEPVANLSIRRLSEFVGSYEKLGSYDDYKNITFEPGTGKIAPGTDVKVKAKFFNLGSAPAKFDVALYIDGILHGIHGQETLTIAPRSEGTHSWNWKAKEGVHSFLVRLDPENLVDESQEYDNFLLRLLDTQGRRKTDKSRRYNWFRGKRYGPAALGYPPEPVGAGFSQGSYIRACDVLLDGIGDVKRQRWGDDDALHFGINAFYEEVIRSCLDPDGYYREGLAYYEMAEDRKGAICWKYAYAKTGINFFELWPIIAKMHLYPVRLRMPDGHYPPINDVSRGGNGYPYWKYVAHLFDDKEDRSVALWDGNLPGGKAPAWNPTQFLTTHQVFRTGWGADDSYVLLSTKHWPAGSRSHDQCDQNSFIFYAKKAFLAIDPGYGQPTHVPVKKWCRENPYAHNMILANGERPPHRHPDVDISVYTYGTPAYPENRFSTGGLDFSESVMYDWETSKGALINTRRSVIFPKSKDYFIMVDSVKSTTGEKHKYEFLLHGDARKPFYGKHRQDHSRPGDYVFHKGAKWNAVPLATNLDITKKNGASEAIWTVQNSDGKDVKYRAFFASPSGLKFEKADGWSGYWYLWGARIKYLKARVNTGNVRFLTVHVADLVDDARDDVTVKSIPLPGDNRGAARIVLPGGDVALVATQDETKPMTVKSGSHLIATDGQISFVHTNGKKPPKKALLVRGSKLALDGRVLLACSAPVQVLGMSWRDDEKGWEAYVNPKTDDELVIRIALPMPPAAVLFRDKKTTFKYENGQLVVKIRGKGYLKATGVKVKLAGEKE